MGAFDGVGQPVRGPVRYDSNRSQGFQRLNQGVSAAPDAVLGAVLSEEGENGERTIGGLLETAIKPDDDSPAVYDVTAPTTARDKKDGCGTRVDVQIGECE